jgi:hypothetical protein
LYYATAVILGWLVCFCLSIREAYNEQLEEEVRRLRAEREEYKRLLAMHEQELKEASESSDKEG